MLEDALSYAVDAWQRSVLFLDVMRQRAVQYEEHAAQAAPHVLDYRRNWSVTGARSRGLSTTRSSASYPLQELSSIRRSAPSSWSILARVMGLESVVSRRTANSASP